MNFTFLTTMLTGLNLLQQTLLTPKQTNADKNNHYRQNMSIERNLLMNCIVGQYGYDARETVCERGTKFCKVKLKKLYQVQ